MLMYIKRIFTNKFLLLTIIGIPIIVYSSYFLYEVFPSWDIITGDHIYNAEKNYSLKEQMIIFILQWNAINLQTSILSVVFPILIIINLISFKEDLNTYFILGKNRFKNYKLSIFKSMINYSLVISLAFTIGHSLIFIIFNQITPLRTDISLESTSYIFNYIIPSDFFDGEPLFYFLTTTILNDLPIIFSYSFLFCVITLFTKNNLYLFIFIPLIIVIVGILISNAFNIEYLSLDTPITGYYSQISNIWKYCLYPLILAAFSGFLYYKWGNNI